MLRFLLKIADRIGHLPLSILYAFSTFLYGLIYKLFGYRKKVVKENLLYAFPEKTADERLQIEKEFYRSFFDIMVETLYCSSISKKEMAKRVQLENPELLKKLLEENSSAIMVCGHFNNWEWLGRQFCIESDQRAYIAYKEISNKDFEDYTLRSRKRFCDHPVKMKSFIRYVLKNRKRPFFGYLIADQTPHVDQIEFTTTFLNQNTAVYLGAENLSQKLKLPMYFLSMKRLKRGYYSYKIELVSENYNAPKFENTKKHLALLERQILENPSDWLWTHRRWKYTRK
ncbi:MAG: lysophospholipid acyltransferase family protein [Flavobacteriales bacterium]|jgi:KDO2-lipid IV(A) lauroyltransferase|nr:lysophospholipid acyltransferase family protein [Flavobacteriales bacterium]